MKTTRRQTLAALSALTLGLRTRVDAAMTEEKLTALLSAIREKHELPALGGAIVASKGLIAHAAVGVRKFGTDVAVTADDLWHLGSNTKAMTATLAAMSVEAGKLKWDSTAGSIFEERKSLAASPLASVTLMQLLTHRSGLPANVAWAKMKDRDAVLDAAAGMKLTSRPGEKFEYSNLGYCIAGHMIEQVLGDTWENMMRTKLFQPLGMNKVGFGGTGTIGQVDQPWPHTAKGKPMPTNGPLIDNPAVLGPAGTVHASLADWGKFISEHLAGARGEGRLLKPDSFKHLHEPPDGLTYACGWVTAERKWGDGRVLNHNGTNTMNYSVAWLALKKDFAVLICTNQGGDASAKACDEAAHSMILARG